MGTKIRISDPSKNTPTQEAPMEKIREKKESMLLVFIIFSLVLMAYGSCSAKGFIDYQGISGFYGHSSWTKIGPDPADNYEWSNISYFVGKDIAPWLSVETLLGPGYIKMEQFNETNSLELRVLMDIHSKHLFFRLGTGVAYLFSSRNMPDISDANFFSIISCSTGFRFVFNKKGHSSREIRLGYSVEHLSDPFKNGSDGDTGLNVGAIIAAFSWQF